MSAVDAYLPAGLGSASLLACLVGALTFVSVMVAWRALLERSPHGATARRGPAPAGAPGGVGGRARRRAVACATRPASHGLFAGCSC